MSGWARVAVQLGATVSGSDRAESPALEKLRALGVAVHVGHDAANVPEGADVFVSTAIPAGNPERVSRALPRAELLRELTALKQVIAIAGAHGKTTTTSMVAHALLGAGAQPGYLIGGGLRTTGENADWGAGDWLVVEADESDKSMLALDVDVAVVLNIELDHHATYGSLAELNEAFDAFRGAAPARVVAPELARDGDTVFAPEDLVLEPGGSRFTWRGHDGRAAGPRRPQRPQRRGGAGGDPRGGRGRPGRGGRRAGELRGGGPAVRATGGDRVRRARRRRLRPSPDRGRGDDRRGAVAGTAAARRDLPAAPVQPDPRAASRVRRSAGGRRRRRRARRLPGPRARRGLPGRLGQADRRGRGRRGLRAPRLLAPDVRRRPGRSRAPAARRRPRPRHGRGRRRRPRARAGRLERSR